MPTKEDKSFERLRFEHELIHRRLTWLLSSQSILFAAYGIALGTAESGAANLFLTVTAMSGTVIASLILIGVVAGILAKVAVWQDSKEKQFGVRTWTTWLGLLPDFALPIVFALAWISLLPS
jgi:hypothetical protein